MDSAGKLRSKAARDPGSKSEGPSGGALPVSLFAGYGAVAAPFEMLRAPAIAIVPALYAKEFGFSLAAISLALLTLRLTDGVTDIFVGVLSDKTRSPWGRRKPWLLASVFLAIPAAYGLYVPGENPNIWSFLLCYFIFYLAWTMFDIPYTAWSAERAHRYEDRSRLALWRGFGGNAGLIILTMVPLLPFLPSTEMNFVTLNALFWVVAVTFTAGVLYAVFRLPSDATATKTERFSFRETISAIKANRPFQIFLGVALLSDMAGGFMGAMFFLFFDTYLKIGQHFTLMHLVAIGLSLVSLQLWKYFLQRTSKSTVLVASMAGAALGGALIALLEPGPNALVHFIIYLSLFFIMQIGREVALYSIFGDIIDYDKWKSAGVRAGIYSSAWMMLRKIALALSGALAFLIAGVIGFDPSASSFSETAIFGLKATNGYIPAILFLAAMFLAAQFPLTKARHRIIQRKLEQRALRSGAVSVQPERS